MYSISKLLLNSLYGRFGLNPSLDKFICVRSTSKKDMENKLEKDLPYLQERIDFGDVSMCSFTSNSITSSNIAIALFVTSYSRVFMSQFKNQEGLQLYYSDTDSIFGDKPISPNLVSLAADDRKLGFLSLESELTDFI